MPTTGKRGTPKKQSWCKICGEMFESEDEHWTYDKDMGLLKNHINVCHPEEAKAMEAKGIDMEPWFFKSGPPKKME